MKRKRFLIMPRLYLWAHGGNRPLKSDLDLKKWQADYEYRIQALKEKNWGTLEKLSRVKSQLAKQREQKKLDCLEKKIQFLLTKINWESRLPRPLSRVICRLLRRRYQHLPHSSSWWRLLIITFTALACSPMLVSYVISLLKFKLPIEISDNFLVSLFSAPLILLVWYFSDINKNLSIQNSRRTASLTEFQELKKCALSKVENMELQLSALQQLRPYLRGEEDKSFHRPAYETLRAQLNQLKGPSSKPQTDTAATATALPTDQLHPDKESCLRQIAQEEWYALLLNHLYPMNHLVLEGVKFLEPLYLPYRNLANLHAPYAQLPNSILCQANLSEANLIGVDLCGADLCGASLCGANLIEANLCRANLIGADLSRPNLNKANFSRPDLGRADLSGAYLREAKLITANLSGAKLIRAVLYSADLSGADLSGADLSGADLSGADLSGADLSGADLTKANLTQTDFSGADLSGADLTKANLTQTDFSGAKLTGTTVTQEQWNQAKSWEGCSPPPTIKA